MSKIYEYNKNRILKIMQDCGCNQTQLGIKFHIPYRTVQNWANGQRECPQYILEMMERIIELEEKQGGIDMKEAVIDEVVDYLIRLVGEATPERAEEMEKDLDSYAWDYVCSKCIGETNFTDAEKKEIVNAAVEIYRKLD